MTQPRAILAKPCPFCGNPRVSVYHDISQDGSGVLIWCIHCECGAQAGWADSGAEALENWESRS